MSSETVTKPPRLTDGQRAFLKRLYQSGGHDRLFNSSFQTAASLHDKGMVVVTIYDTHNGHIEITEAGKRVAEALIELLSSAKGRVSVSDVLKGTAYPTGGRMDE